MILAVDPGARGAVAWVHDADGAPGLISLAGHDLVQLFLRFQSISHLALENEPRIAYLEENTGFIAGSPRTGASMYAFGRHTGRIEMALASLGFEIRRVRPLAWQKALSAPKRRSREPHSAFKGRLATFARETNPSLSSRITKDAADALLVLRYGIKDLEKTHAVAD